MHWRAETRLPEIVSEILDHVCTSETPIRQQYATLAALARTCTQFHGPAVDVLWRTQQTIVPLIMCLPSDAYTVNKVRKNNTVLALTRNLHPEDFIRVHHYAYRIKALGRTTFAGYKDISKTPALSGHVLPILLARNPIPGPLLHNLSYAFIKDDQAHGYAVLPRLILSPALEALDVLVGTEGEVALTAWSNLRLLFEERSVDLKRVAVYMRPARLGPGLLQTPGQPTPPATGNIWQPEFAQALLSFQNMTSLDIGEIYWNPTTASFLSTLKSLQVLRVSVSLEPGTDEKDALTDAASLITTQPHFPALTRLMLLTPSLQSPICRLVLTSLKSNTLLHSLSVYETSSSTVELQTFLEETFTPNPDTTPHATGAPFHNLHHLHIERNPALGPGPKTAFPLLLDSHPFILGPYTLTPLHPLTSLRSLTLSPARTVLMDNTTLHDLSRAFPHLEALHLQEPTTESAPTITLLGLLHLLSGCPRLSALTLRLDARETPPFLDCKGFRAHTHPIALNFQSSPMANASQLAQFLILYIPALEKLEYVEDDEVVADWYDHSWMKVKMQIAPLIGGVSSGNTAAEQPIVEEAD
ncbi:hypothetical protein DFP72DRAFT_1172138 [Ephemerocybe angulata]|uniref:F-box domain-containing protein n=1 Tax=Ephemerocybe angulata TaxID=980116 RepID=A0A8H6HS86_9AGAR|nr:hypothetical protein DFP72DRAFT_1172138 [Tulosesus angulatus]